MVFQVFLFSTIKSNSEPQLFLLLVCQFFDADVDDAAFGSSSGAVAFVGTAADAECIAGTGPAGPVVGPACTHSPVGTLF